MTTFSALLVWCLYLNPAYPWSEAVPVDTPTTRFQPPAGYSRPEQTSALGLWLRNLPLKPKNSPVRLFDGHKKTNQRVHVAVIEIDTGNRDLQQCADAVMRLHAEFLRSQNRDAEIRFRFTSGDPLYWSDWRSGQRPEIRGNRVVWQAKAAPSRDYATFKKYLRTVFTYCGTASLARDSIPVKNPADIQAGDFFVDPGYPGHAVIVIDIALNPAGQKTFLLAQSYMPAQDIHILKNPMSTVGSPWYAYQGSDTLNTPEWRFSWSQLRRFP